MATVFIPNRPPGRSLLLLAILTISLEFVSASPTESKPTATSPHLQLRSTLPDGTLSCETDRSSDYYGLGVRLGVYFAWFQNWIANVAVPSEISNALDTNAVFLFAILVAMLKCTLTQLLEQMDGLLLMHMGGGTVFSVLSIWGYRTCQYDINGPVGGMRQFGGYGTHLRLLLCTAFSSFGMFFWVYGMSGALPQNDDERCRDLHTFMFAKVRAKGPIRGFYIFISIACMVYFGSMLLTSLIAASTRLRRFKYAYQRGNSSERTRLWFATGLNQKQLRYVFYFLRVSNLLFIIYSILLVEFTLNYNSVAGVLGWRGHIFFPSQVIPMIIGAFGFVKVIYIRYQNWKAPKSDPVSLHSSSRSALQFNTREIVQMYTAKSNPSMDFAHKRKDSEMDPVMAGQPIWLRLLVSWLPWLAILRWWASDDKGSYQAPDHYDSQYKPSPSQYNPCSDGSDPETPKSIRWSQDSTPHIGHHERRGTWNSDMTATSTWNSGPGSGSPRRNFQLPETPRNLHHFGNI